MKKVKEIEKDIKSQYAEREVIEKDKDLTIGKKKKAITAITKRVKFLKNCIVVINSIPNMSDEYLQKYIDKCNLKISKIKSEQILSNNAVEIKAHEAKKKRECKAQYEYISRMTYIMNK
jgi:glycerol-3-phosphate cytidylyltransferase-like family protein